MKALQTFDGLNIDLMLEITRWCNFSCIHCLRGDRISRKMSDEIINRALFIAGNKIDSILFTGGEPTLAIDKIEKTLEVCIQRSIRVAYFQIVTNTSGINRRFIYIMDRWIDYVDEPSMIYVSFSHDQYHDKLEYNENKYRFEEMLEYKKISIDKRGSIPDCLVVNQGRAVDNFCATKKATDFTPDMNGGYPQDFAIYVNVKGDVISGCDYSFEEQKNHKIGSIFDEDIVEKYFKYFKLNLEDLYEKENDYYAEVEACALQS